MQDETGHKQEIRKENTPSQHTDSAQKQFSNNIYAAGFHPHEAGLENLDQPGIRDAATLRSITLCIPLLRTCLVACMFRGVGQVIGRDVLRSLHQYVHPLVNLPINLQLGYMRQGIGSIRAETRVYPLKETTRECRKASPSGFPGFAACFKKMLCSYVVRKPYFTLKTYL